MVLHEVLFKVSHSKEIQVWNDFKFLQMFIILSMLKDLTDFQIWLLVWAQALPFVKLVDLHIVSHFWLETFSVLQYAVDFGSISKEDLRESQSWQRSSLLTLAPIT